MRPAIGYDRRDMGHISVTGSMGWKVVVRGVWWRNCVCVVVCDVCIVRGGRCLVCGVRWRCVVVGYSERVVCGVWSEVVKSGVLTLCAVRCACVVGNVRFEGARCFVFLRFEWWVVYGMWWCDFASVFILIRRTVCVISGVWCVVVCHTFVKWYTWAFVRVETIVILRLVYNYRNVIINFEIRFISH